MSFCYYEISVFNITREFVELTLITNITVLDHMSIPPNNSLSHIREHCPSTPLGGSQP